MPASLVWSYSFPVCLFRCYLKRSVLATRQRR